MAWGALLPAMITHALAWCLLAAPALCAARAAARITPAPSCPQASRRRPVMCAAHPTASAPYTMAVRVVSSPVSVARLGAVVSVLLTTSRMAWAVASSAALPRCRARRHTLSAQCIPLTVLYMAYAAIMAVPMSFSAFVMASSSGSLPCCSRLSLFPVCAPCCSLLPRRRASLCFHRWCLLRCSFSAALSCLACVRACLRCVRRPLRPLSPCAAAVRLACSKSARVAMKPLLLLAAFPPPS